MGDFDFGQFQQIYEYLIQKLQEGGALTPEEQKAYDGLMAIANQGLNLTQTADFKSLYTAFNTLADDETKQKFEELYGTGFTQDPNTGEIQFTRPGTLVAALMRRGLSVRDGPVQALLSEGLKNFMDTTAKNSFAAMTNSYQAMTPIRAQNIQAATNAGTIAANAIGRRAAVVGGAISGARGGSGAGDSSTGETNLPIPPTPQQPSLFDKILPALIPALATGGLGLLGKLIDHKPSNDPTKPPTSAPGTPSTWTGREQADYTNRAERLDIPDRPLSTPDYARSDYTNRAERTDLTPYNPYQVDQSAYQGNYTNRAERLDLNNPYGINQSAFQTGGAGYNPYADMYSGQAFQPSYNGAQSMYDSGWTQPTQGPTDYQDYGGQTDWYQPSPDQTTGYYDDPYQGYDWTAGGGDSGGNYDYSYDYSYPSSDYGYSDFSESY